MIDGVHATSGNETLLLYILTDCNPPPDDAPILIFEYDDVPILIVDVLLHNKLKLPSLDNCVVLINPVAVNNPAEVIVPDPVVEILPDVEIFPEPPMVPVTVNTSPLGNEMPPSAVSVPVTDNAPLIVVEDVELPIFTGCDPTVLVLIFVVVVPVVVP